MTNDRTIFTRRPMETAVLGLGRFWRWLLEPTRDEPTARPGRRWMNG